MNSATIKEAIDRVIIVDEVCMLQMNLLVRLQQYLLDNPTQKIYGTGDFGQNAPVEASEGVH